jgi:hypothetical protein
LSYSTSHTDVTEVEAGRTASASNGVRLLFRSGAPSPSSWFRLGPPPKGGSTCHVLSSSTRYVRHPSYTYAHTHPTTRCASMSSVPDAVGGVLGIPTVRSINSISCTFMCPDLVRDVTVPVARTLAQLVHINQWQPGTTGPCRQGRLLQAGQARLQKAPSFCA